jgi:hypothetical protein
MKRFIALLLAGVIFIGLAACGDTPETERARDDIFDDPVEPTDGEGIVTQPQQETPAPPTTTEDPYLYVYTPPFVTEPELEPIEPVNAEAEALLDLLWKNKTVWGNNNMMGGTLIDLDFDGVPEFLLFNGAEDDRGWVFGQSITVYRIADNELIEIAELTANVSTGAETPHQHISLYTDEFGNRSWAFPYVINSGDTTEQRMSLFDFTGDRIDEFVKFASIRIDDDWGSMTFFHNEQELTLSDEEVRVYNEMYIRYEAEREWFQRDPDDYIANSAQEFYCYEGMGDEKGVFFPSALYIDEWVVTMYLNVSAKWWAMKRDFEVSLAPTSYKLAPNNTWDRNNYWNTRDENEVYASLVKLVNAYVMNNEEYLLDPWGAYSLGAMAKPVVYLYPEEPTDVEVLVTFPYGGYFTAVYPDYGDGWRVTAFPDGTLINHADNREYQYLYWAGKGPANWDFSRGFVVKGSDTVAFFQEKLAYLGLIPREYNEFIVYYLPLMQKNEYNLITFQTTVYEENVHMQITPEPDSILRIFMAFMPLDKPINVPEQTLEPFERRGFAVIEWGGTEVSG